MLDCTEVVLKQKHVWHLAAHSTYAMRPPQKKRVPYNHIRQSLTIVESEDVVRDVVAAFSVGVELEALGELHGVGRVVDDQISAHHDQQGVGRGRLHILCKGRERGAVAGVSVGVGVGGGGGERVYV